MRHDIKTDKLTPLARCDNYIASTSLLFYWLSAHCHRCFGTFFFFETRLSALSINFTPSWKITQATGLFTNAGIGYSQTFSDLGLWFKPMLPRAQTSYNFLIHENIQKEKNSLLLRHEYLWRLPLVKIGPATMTSPHFGAKYVESVSSCNRDIIT